jgi:transposase
VRRRNFTKEFKDRAVLLTENNEKPIVRVAEELEIHEKTLRQWRREAREAKETGAEAFPGHGKPRHDGVERLLVENNMLREENSVLRKALKIIAREELPESVKPAAAKP